MGNIKLLLVDDHEIVRKGLASILQLEPAFEVAGEASSADEAVSLARHLRPDVVILDLKMGSECGSVTTKRIMEAHPDTRVLILTAFVEEGAVNDCLAAGARGYVLKDVDSRKLLDQIRAVSQGEEVFDRRVLEIVVKRFREKSRVDAKRHIITQQEVCIIRYVSEGLTNKQIAQKMFLSENTIKSYLQDIMNKLGVNNRAELVNKALRKSLI